MSDYYRFLADADLAALVRERVTALEIEHYRTVILLCESANSEEEDALQAKLTEIERRKKRALQLLPSEFQEKSALGSNDESLTNVTRVKEVTEL